MESNNRFSRHQRLRRSQEFGEIFERGQVVSDATLVMHGIIDRQQPARLGLSISRRVGNAVVRNRWKRLIREAYRTNYALIPEQLTIVVRPRKGAEPNLTSISNSLRRLTKLLHRRAQAHCE